MLHSGILNQVVCDLQFYDKPETAAGSDMGQSDSIEMLAAPRNFGQFIDQCKPFFLQRIREASSPQLIMKHYGALVCDSG